MNDQEMDAHMRIKELEELREKAQAIKDMDAHLREKELKEIREKVKATMEIEDNIRRKELDEILGKPAEESEDFILNKMNSDGEGTNISHK